VLSAFVHGNTRRLVDDRVVWSLGDNLNIHMGSIQIFGVFERKDPNFR
jgi:hypothetical protein